MNLDHRLLNAARSTALLVFLTVLSGLGAGIFAVLQARGLSRVVTAVFLEGSGLSGVWSWMLALLGVIAVRAGCGFLSEWFAAGLAARVKTDLRSRIYAHILRMGPVGASRRPAGELVALSVQGVDALDAYLSQYLPQLALAALIPLAVLLFAFPIDPISAAILLVTGPLIPFFMFLIGQNAEKLTSRQFAALGKMSAFFLDTLQGLKTLKALGRSREYADRVESVSERYRVVTLEVLRFTFLSALALELLSTLSTAVIAVQVGLRLLYGQMSFEPAFFLLIIAPEFYLPLRTLGLRFHASRSGAVASRQIFALLEEPLPAEAASSPEPLSPGWDEISFENVSYQYPDRPDTALNGLSMRLAKGSRVALVGESGSGKSTAAAVLLRFIEPQSGLVRVGNMPLPALAPRAWRKQIAWVPQRPHFFEGNLATNLRIANDKAPNESLWRALEGARLAEWVRSLPSGLETPVGSDASRLSGGQAHRLALARAFLRDAPLLILDEPTAHLDPLEETLLEQAIADLCVGRTVLLIAHRLATAARADQVLVMAQGRAVQTGAPTALSARPGPFADLLAAYEGAS